MDGEDIARRARESLSRFCMEECKSYCCRKGHLTLNKKEVDTVFREAGEDAKRTFLLKQAVKDSFVLELKCDDSGCPCFMEGKCIIHKDPGRPKVCQDYPVFVVGDMIRLSSRCLAVRLNMLYPFVKEWMNAGYNITESYSIEDSDIYPPPKIAIASRR
mgnify:CR=1 FL=1